VVCCQRQLHHDAESRHTIPNLLTSPRPSPHCRSGDSATQHAAGPQHCFKARTRSTSKFALSQRHQKNEVRCFLMKLTQSRLILAAATLKNNNFVVHTKETSTLPRLLGHCKFVRLHSVLPFQDISGDAPRWRQRQRSDITAKCGDSRVASAPRDAEPLNLGEKLRL